MMVAINVVLLALGFAGTLAAFGGETWRKGDEPLKKRVTQRGWISLTCLCLALILGIFKEIRNSTEKSGLEAEISRLSEQVKRQRSLLAVKRVDEIREQDETIEALMYGISLIKGTYEKFRNFNVSVQGRAQSKGAPPPVPLSFSYLSSNFFLDVCSENFEKAAQLRFAPSGCRSVVVPSVIRLLPTNKFERSEYGPSIIAVLQYLAEISVAVRDAINGPHKVAKENARLVTLADVLPEAQKVCGIPAKAATDQTNRAKRTHAIEEASQQLHWLFKFGYASANPEYSKWLDQQFKGSASELLVQMSQLSGTTSSIEKPDKEESFRLGMFTDSIASNYQKLLNDLDLVSNACRVKRLQLKDELHHLKSP